MINIERLFPYTPRTGQSELIDDLEHKLRRSRFICLHAPTGFGKTIAVLSVLLPLAMKERCHILWSVRTGNETDRPVEELKVIKRKFDVDVFGLSFRGKRDMCLAARTKGIRDYESVNNFCSMYRNRCPYYRRLDRFELDFPDEPLLFSEIMEMGRRWEVCPYFLQLRMLEYADLVSMSYNYIFSPVGWVIRRFLPFRKSFLVVDEAHNLQKVVPNLNSDSLTLRAVEGCIREARSFPDFPPDILDSLVSLKENMEALRRSLSGEDDVYDPEDLLRRSGISTEHLKIIYKFGNKVLERRLAQGKSPRSHLRHMASFFARTLELRNVLGVYNLMSMENGKFSLNLADMRCSEILKELWPNFRRVVFMSGTLEPIDAFSEVVGVEGCSGIVKESFVRRENVISFVLTDVTTRGDELSGIMRDRYCRAICSFIERVRGNVAVFSASYRIQSEISDPVKEFCDSLGIRVFEERKGMGGDEARTLLDEFKMEARSGRKGVLLAIAGGRFAEGADFPGEELLGAFIVGIPFDRLTMRTRLYIDYYQRLYGIRRGRYLSYVVPALRRVSQAVGRVIRCEEDRGIFVLGDHRFRRPTYMRLLPDFIRDDMIPTRHDVLGGKIDISAGRADYS